MSMNLCLFLLFCLYHICQEINHTSVSGRCNCKALDEQKLPYEDVFLSTLIDTNWPKDVINSYILNIMEPQINTLIKYELRSSFLGRLFNHDFKFTKLDVANWPVVLCNIVIKSRQTNFMTKSYLIYNNYNDYIQFTLGNHITISCWNISLHGKCLVRIANSPGSVFERIVIQFIGRPCIHFDMTIIFTILYISLDISYLKIHLYNSILDFVENYSLIITPTDIYLQHKMMY